MATILDFVQAHPFLDALIVSVIGGIPVTWISSKFLHSRLTKPTPDTRRPWIGLVLGILERALLTTFTIWMPMGVGPFAGALVVVKSITGWGGIDQKDELGRARFSVALMGSLISVLWAIGCGLWASIK